MMSLNFKKWDTILGWVIFGIALITYSLTVEPTASFWDCAEYIATSAKLQVGHPPGAPFFQMMGAIFATFASSPDQIAKMVNYMSVFSSAFTILFMFWTITNLVRKVATLHEKDFGTGKQIAVLGSGVVGALAFTFSDSFWFNAVEAEVYAMATCIMALLFWLSLKWADEMHTERGNRWLILIALVTGLSFGVHFMGLLTIPGIGMIYFFKNYKTITVKNFILANVISIGVLLFIFKLLLPYTLASFGYLEVFFVNTFGLPFNSGTIITGIIIVAIFYFLLKYTKKKNYPILNTITLCVVFILIGFSTWLMIPIRANANTVINENSPSDARLLLAYYNLEQYPETHLFYGPMYSDIYAGLDKDKPFVDDKPKYERDHQLKKYVVVNDWKEAKQNSESSHKGFMPRMWSPEHATNYMQYAGALDFKVLSLNSILSDLEQYEDLTDDQIKFISAQHDQIKQAATQIRLRLKEGSLDAEEYEDILKTLLGSGFVEVQRPSLLQNIGYLINYQMGYMYWRYFMWNFAGRQDDIQGKMDNHGNWISGINFIDELFLGVSQDNLPSDVVNNKARNTYFFLPLILGLIGFTFLLFNAKKQFWILLVFFLFTGLALKVYLNERPFEPRERDYALVGSFYVFAIWIGYGAYALFDQFKAFASPKITAIAVSTFSLLAVPTLMAFQNWDDHDRSNRYTAQATAKSYLDSIQEDVGAIIFTIGDNDTFALWYAQDVEGYRTDVRSVNTSLLATDWYIDQMKRKAYESEAVPSQMTHDKYKYGTRDIIRYVEHPSVPDSTVWELKDFMKWVLSDGEQNREGFIKKMEHYPKSQQNRLYYPVYKIRVPVNKENVLKYGIVKPEDADKIVEHIDIELPRSAIYKNNLMMLDMLNTNDWKRPIYFTGGSFDKAEYLWMKDYLQMEGLVYKLVPIKTKLDSPYDMGRVDSDIMYDNVMKWNWGNSGSDEIYHDPQTRRQSISYRSNIARLIEQLLKEGKKEKAKKVIDLTLEKMPLDYFGYYVFTEPYIDGYFKVGEDEKAAALFDRVKTKYQEYLDYYAGLKLSNQYRFGEDIVTYLEKYRSLVDILITNDQKALFEKEAQAFHNYIDKFQHLMPTDDE